MPTNCHFVITDIPIHSLPGYHSYHPAKLCRSNIVPAAACNVRIPLAEVLASYVDYIIAVQGWFSALSTLYTIFSFRKLSQLHPATHTNTATRGDTVGKQAQKVCHDTAVEPAVPGAGRSGSKWCAAYP